MTQIRYSEITIKFCESVRFKCSATVYKLLFGCRGIDPDAGGLANIVGPSEPAIMENIRKKTGESSPGLVSITDLTRYYDRAKLSWKPDGVGHDPKFLVQLDLTEVKREALSSGPFSGEGETKMGIFTDGPDRQDRIQWAKAVHDLCSVPDENMTYTERQNRMFGLSQTLDECLAIVLATSEKYATSLKMAKQTQLSSAKEELKGTDHELGDSWSVPKGPSTSAH